MMRPLPVGDFRFLNEEEKARFRECVMTVPLDGPKGYVVVANLAYPQRLHDLHADYPLAPEHLEIQDHMLGPAQKAMLGELALDEQEIRGNTANEPIAPNRLAYSS